jgi:hypothetical protein
VSQAEGEVRKYDVDIYLDIERHVHLAPHTHRKVLLHSIDGDADMVYTLLSRREVIEAISSSASVANRASPPGATPTM